MVVVLDLAQIEVVDAAVDHIRLFHQLFVVICHCVVIVFTFIWDTQFKLRC